MAVAQSEKNMVMFKNNLEEKYFTNMTISYTNTHFKILRLFSATLLLSLFVNIGYSTKTFAATSTWDFSTSGDYTFDSSTIEVTSGNGALKAKSDWYNISWPYRKTLTIDADQVGTGGVTDFPVYVDLATDADLVFTSSDGTTKLAHDIDRFTQVTDDGIWTWYNDPRAVRSGNRTFIGYLSEAGNVTIAQFDHTSRVWSTFTLKGASQVDDHNNPAIAILPSGRIAVFYAQHNGNAYYRVSTNANDISAWGSEINLLTATGMSASWSYVNPHVMDDGTTYLFWRMDVAGGYYSKATSENDLIAGTWQAGKQYISANDRPYMKFSSDGTRIHMIATDGHPDVNPSNSVYYMKLENGNFYKVDGTLIISEATVFAGSPVTTAEMDKVYDGSGANGRGWTWDVHYDDNNYPVIAYVAWPGSTNTSAPDSRYRYARWDGSAWVDNEITPGGGAFGITTGNSLSYLQPFYNGGVVIDSDNPSIVYTSRQQNTSEWIIEKWTTADNGLSWTSETIKSSGFNIRPYSVRNATSGAELSLLWVNPKRYVGYVDFRGTIETLTTGAVQTLNVATDVHVRVPTISSSANTALYVYYGNMDATEQASPQSVRSGKYAHLNHQSHGASTKVGTAKTYVGGTTKGESFNGLNISGDSKLTIMAWVNASGGYIVNSWHSISVVSGVIFRIVSGTLNGFIRTSSGTSLGGNFPGATYTADTWQHVALVYDKDDGGLKAYHNGVISPTSYPSTEAFSSNSSRIFTIGYSTHADTNWLVGSLDEVAILSETALSAADILTVYNNQNSTSTFYSLASEETLYHSSQPTVTPSSALSVTSLSGFTESANTNGGAIKYQLSNDDGTTWYWYDDGWTTTSSGYSETNTATEINSNISSFPIGNGQFVFKAYLNSDGTQLVQLSEINVTYSNEQPSSDPTPVNTSVNTSGGHSRQRAIDLGLIPQPIDTQVVTPTNSTPIETSQTQNQLKGPFTKTLRYKMVDPNVRRLQIFLNQDPDTRLDEKRAGSPGKETDFFGPKTRAAVIRFQEKYGKDILSPWNLFRGTGYIGETTLAKINELISKTAE